MTHPKVLMLGYHSLLGQMILELLNFSNVVGIDRIFDKTHQLKISKFIQADLTQDFDESVRYAMSKADVIFIAIPFFCLRSFSNQMIPFLKKDAVLIDILSVKSNYIKLIKCQEQVQNKHFSLLSLNPLFRPGMNLTDRKICVCTYRPTKFTQSLINKLSTSLEVIELTSFEQHDKIMGAIQGAPHFTILALVMFLKNSGFSYDIIHIMETVFMEGIFAVISRLLMGKSHVYWDIQVNNEHAKEARDQLKQSLVQLDQIINENNNKVFDKLFNELKDFLRDKEVYNEKFLKLLEV